jgi:protein involved in polysaccharide export with SLBB domain
LLRQSSPDIYRLGTGDILGVWIEGVLGEKAQAPPVKLPEPGGGGAPAIGYPVPVRENGTVALPLVDPVKVEGLSITEAQEEIIKAYTVKKEILAPGRERVIVSLMRRRQFHVLVIRQDTGAVAVASGQVGSGPALVGQTKRGTGYVVDLPAYENDVLNALARTGGLPGLDAANEVIIERGRMNSADSTVLQGCPKDTIAGPAGSTLGLLTRIPLRLRPGESVGFRPDDIILRDGDIVFIESRDTEVFYTGGLMPPRQFGLPRDYSIDVVEAIAYANGPLVNGGQSVNNLSGNLIQGGLGFPSPSLVTILRRTAGGGQITIRVDLNRALRDPRERVLIQPGDVIILQETLCEAITRYATEVLRLNFLGTIVRQHDLVGTTNVTLP